MSFGVGFILSHSQHNFLRCSHTGNITVSIIIIGGFLCFVNRKLHPHNAPFFGPHRGKTVVCSANVVKLW
nr:MAG TPA: hypothetical protein [Caudoviricetes sp.]